MRCVGWTVFSVLNSALACAGTAQARPDDAAPTAPCVNRNACISIVHAYETGRRAGLEEARAAVDRLRELCANGEGIACWGLANQTALGLDDIVTPDIDAARGFARRSCDLGFNCKVLEALSLAPPTPAEEDDIREAVFRAGIPRDRPRNARNRSPYYCLAFGTDADPLGKDPPPEFMARFADLEDVKPRSWCVEHRTGNRHSVGPIDASPRPFPPVRRVRMWRLVQNFSGGGGGARTVHVAQEAGTWVVGDGDSIRWEGKTWGAADPDQMRSRAVPALPEADLAEDKRRINGVVAEFAKAWNGRDLEAMARLNPGEDPNMRSLWQRLNRTMPKEGADTRIDSSAESIEFGEAGSMSATARVRLRGTWTPSPGAIVPLDPWKHEGAVTTVRLRLQKQTSWWEPGGWTVHLLRLPWEEGRFP